MSKENLIIFLLVLCIILSGGALVSTFIGKAPAQIETANTIGVAKTFVKPDIAYLTVGVTSNKATVTEALNDSNAKMNAIMGALKTLGLSEDDMQTSSFWVSPEYNYNDQPPTLTGYNVTNNITVRTAPDKLSAVISKAAEKGANNFYDFQLQVEKIEEVKNSLLPKAIEDAKKNAETLAASFGKQVKSFKMVSYEFINPTSIQPIYGAEAGAGGEVYTPTASGMNEVQVKVYVTFELSD